MSFKTEKEDNYTIIKFSTDKLDAIVAPDLKAELVVISRGGSKNILIDLESVKYCDSSGLGALLIGYRLCKEAKGSFVLSSIQATVQQLIVISQLDTVLTIKTSIEEAINSLFIDKEDENIEAK